MTRKNVNGVNTLWDAPQQINDCVDTTELQESFNRVEIKNE